jgi:transcription-repair coupling factor (superfamily II helicase)
MLDLLRSLPVYQDLLRDLSARKSIPGLSLLRSARLPVMAALKEDLPIPMLLITDRADHALTLFDEIKFWSPDISRFLFPEPNPLFYEQASWGTLTRRDRIQVLTSLAVYHLPGAPKPEKPPVVIAPIRAIMARTLPRRDFLKYSKTLKPGLTIYPESLQRAWVEIGYQAADTVLEPGQFSRRGGLLDIWPPSEAYPSRLDFFGDEIETIRRFDPATQRTYQVLDLLLVTPAREILPGKAAGMNLASLEVDEFYLPVVHPAPADRKSTRLNSSHW